MLQHTSSEVNGYNCYKHLKKYTKKSPWITDHLRHEMHRRDFLKKKAKFLLDHALSMDNVCNRRLFSIISYFIWISVAKTNH